MWRVEQTEDNEVHVFPATGSFWHTLSERCACHLTTEMTFRDGVPYGTIFIHEERT